MKKEEKTNGFVREADKIKISCPFLFLPDIIKYLKLLYMTAIFILVPGEELLLFLL